MTYAKASSRATDSAAILCGLFNIPVAVYGRTTEYGVTRKQMHAGTDNPAGVRTYDKVTGVELAASDIDKRVLVTAVDGSPLPMVFVSPEEEERLFSMTPHSIAIKGMYPAHSVGTTFLVKSYHSVRPAKMDKKEYMPHHALLATFLEGLRRDNLVAFGEWVTRGKPKPVVILPDGQLLVVYYEEEVRELIPLGFNLETLGVDEETLDMVHAMFHGMAGGEEVDLSDHRTTLINEFARAKAEAGDTAPSVTVEVAPAPAAAAQDVMAALKAQMRAATAPAAPAKPARPKPVDPPAAVGKVCATEGCTNPARSARAKFCAEHARKGAAVA